MTNWKTCEEDRKYIGSEIKFGQTKLKQIFTEKHGDSISRQFQISSKIARGIRKSINHCSINVAVIPIARGIS